jgi:broad specificity phosphatase PhoE
VRKLAIMAAVAAGMALAAGAASAQTVVLVRHAEKADASRDPVLSEAGTRRARALAELFGVTRPDLAIVSPMRRTRLTAEPTVPPFGVPLITVSLDGGVDAHVAAVISAARDAGPEALVLIVGHSNTVPLIARALGVESADMPECEYDRMTRIDLNGPAPTAVVTRYGAASTC